MGTIAARFAVAGVVFLVSACGEGKTTPEPANENVPPEGVFAVAYGEFDGVYTFLNDGRIYGVHLVREVIGHVHGKPSKDNSATDLEQIAWANFVDDPDQVGAQEPDGKFGRDYDGKELIVKISGSMGTFEAVTKSQMHYSVQDREHQVYRDALDLEALAGSYEGNLRTVGFGQPLTVTHNFEIDLEGGFSSTVGDCTFVGLMSQYEDTGVYEVEMSASGDQCGFNGDLKGIVIPLEVLPSGPVLVFRTHSPSPLYGSFDVNGTRDSQRHDAA